MGPFSLGLRSRVTFAFAMGGLLITILLMVITLGIAQQVLLGDRDEVAEVVVFSNAARVQRLLTGDLEADAVLGVVETVNTSVGSRPLLVIGDRNFSLDESQFSLLDVPQSLQAATGERQAARMRTQVQDEPMILYGVPIQRFEDVVYYEAVPLTEVEDTLGTLRNVLLGGGIIVAVVAAMTGRFAAGRALRPLRDVGEAAEAIAGGRLETRLDTKGDEDLSSLAASFNEMAGGLEERIQRDARFASEVSHELRSPLMTLAASVEVLENARADMPPRAQTALELLSSDIHRFQNLVEDLLEISRYDVGTADLQTDAILFAEFVRAAVDVASSSDIPVEVSPDAENVILEADKRRLARVVANLVDNAAKYGGGASRVEVSTSADTVVLAVEDNGPGVPDDERFNIFDRFSRGGAGGRRGYDTGVGLGLSLVAEHVNLHRGRVWVEDCQDGSSGARFVVQLPIAPLEGDED
ncbi:MAG: HAMP domain-containing histidine kinase [Acidimicrobiales bacterium]|nr:HAMP domain-containing histidine kinase [Acidimicrobiales bacterium]RZV47136.1 MAG: HAMP domain-containing histidine kinase [Acidimicrobiales bacterium]